jgi:hypothetical protein
MCYGIAEWSKKSRNLPSKFTFKHAHMYMLYVLDIMGTLALKERNE